MSDDAKGNSIMIAIGKAKKKPSFGGGMAEAKGSEPDMDDSEEASSDEVDAMKAFTDASSPEEKASALKLFIKLCTEGGY